MRESYNKNLYEQALMISDSCSAVTLFDKLTSPNIIAIGSSSENEKSYSHGNDLTLHLAKTDKFSFINYQYLNDNFDKNPELTLHDLIQKYTFEELNGHYGLVNTSKERTPKQVKLKDFFTNQKKIIP